jgi:hypothetical protein
VVIAILIECVVLCLTFGCFLVAAIAEIRSYKMGPAFVLRMVEIGAEAVSLWALTNVCQSRRTGGPGSRADFAS